MGVIKTGAVGGENKPRAEAFRKAIRKHNAPLYVEDFDRRVISAALPHRVGKEVAILRDRNDRDCCCVSAPPECWVNQNSFRIQTIHPSSL